MSLHDGRGSGKDDRKTRCIQLQAPRQYPARAESLYRCKLPVSPRPIQMQFGQAAEMWTPCAHGSVNVALESSAIQRRRRLQSEPGRSPVLVPSVFLSPMAALAYVSQFELWHGSADVLIRVPWILAASLTVSFFCAVTQPIAIIDEETMTRAGRANLCLALVDTVLFLILVRNPAAVDQACLLGVTCRTYPAGWLALAGMHYCYAVWAYVIMLVNR